jgi:hypothetical protein
MSHPVIKPLPQHESAGDGDGAGRFVAWVILLGLAFWPRLWILGFWIFDHKGLGQAFSSWVVPVIGFFVLPWTTLLYAWMWSIGSDGVHGWEWILVGGAFLVDVTFWAAGRRSLR